MNITEPSEAITALNRCPGYKIIDGRKVLLCSQLQYHDPSDLVLHCEKCGRFVVQHCPHTAPDESTSATSKHYLFVAFTDGACRNNGRLNAQSGVGVACGAFFGQQRSAFPRSKPNNIQTHTSQRAELQAALHSLKILAQLDNENEWEYRGEVMRNECAKKSGLEGFEKAWIIVSDSAYVVKGMTEWLPTWKVLSIVPLGLFPLLTSIQVNGFKTTQGRAPDNLDLFLRLDSMIETQEAVHHLKIGFLHIRREYNEVADRHAKHAADVGASSTQ